MTTKIGQRYRCLNPNYRCEIEMTRASTEANTNPSRSFTLCCFVFENPASSILKAAASSFLPLFCTRMTAKPNCPSTRVRCL